ncbi:MAG: hypothetical protein JNL98_18945 [Bryobacterales bacterium]|nr:hypothetical protein [Bryobacterales bacterium]
MGLSVDVGRLFLNKNEAQTFVDSAVLDAARRLDGTAAGIEAARQAVEQNRNRWDFGTRRFERYVLEFASEAAPDQWTSLPRLPSGYQRVRLTVSVTQKLLFLPALVPADSQLIAASAAAAQTPIQRFHQGLFPLAVPVTGAAPHFGLSPGQTLKLRAATRWWGDARPKTLEERVLADHHGDPDAAGGPVTIGQPLPAGPIPPEADALIAARPAQDGDVLSTTYSTYLQAGRGNGRRLVRLPLVDAATGVTAGAGMFFLGAPGRSGWLEYTGRAALPNSVHPGAGPPGIYTVRLIQ